MTVSFKALTADHRPLLTRWLQEPHVRAFWDDGEGETWGGDLLSGEAELTGRGLGPAVIRAFLEILKSERPALRRILIDPHPTAGVRCGPPRRRASRP